MRGIIELYVTQLLSGAVPAHEKGGKGVQLYMVGHVAHRSFDCTRLYWVVKVLALVKCKPRESVIMARWTW